MAHCPQRRTALPGFPGRAFAVPRGNAA